MPKIDPKVLKAKKFQQSVSENTRHQPLLAPTSAQHTYQWQPRKTSKKKTRRQNTRVSSKVTTTSYSYKSTGTIPLWPFIIPLVLTSLPVGFAHNIPDKDDNVDLNLLPTPLSKELYTFAERLPQFPQYGTLDLSQPWSSDGQLVLWEPSLSRKAHKTPLKENYTVSNSRSRHASTTAADSSVNKTEVVVMRETAAISTNPSVIDDITVSTDGKTAFAAAGVPGIIICDIINLGQLLIKTTVETRGDAKQAIPHPNPAEQNILLVADFSDGLSAINTSGVEPRLIARTNTTRHINWITHIPGQQDLIATASDYGIAIYNISLSTITSPIEVHYHPAPVKSRNRLKYTRKLVLIENNGLKTWAIIHNSREGITLLDASDIFNMTELSTLTMPGDSSVAFSDLMPLRHNSNYVATVFNNRESLAIFDISNRTNPVYKSSLDLPGLAESIVPLQENPELYMVGITYDHAGVTLVNLADPNNPFAVSYIQLPSPVYSTAQSRLHQGYIFTAAYQAGLRVLEHKSNPMQQASSLDLVSSVEMPPSRFGGDPASSIIQISGTLNKQQEIITTSLWAGLSKFKISNTVNGTELALINSTAESSTYEYGLKLPGQDGQFIVARGEEIEIVDKDLNSISTLSVDIGSTTYLDMYANSQNIVVVAGFNKIALINTSDVNIPYIISTIENLSGTVNAVMSYNHNGKTFIVSVTYDGELSVIDATNIQDLEIISKTRSFKNTKAIKLLHNQEGDTSGPYIAISNGESGVNIYNLENPRRPVRVSNIQTTEISDSSINTPKLPRQNFITNGEDGLAIINQERILEPVTAVTHPTDRGAFYVITMPGEVFRLIAATYTSLALFDVTTIAAWQTEVGNFPVATRSTYQLNIYKTGLHAEHLRPDPTTITIQRIDLSNGRTRKAMYGWHQQEVPDDLEMSLYPPREAIGPYALEVMFNATTVMDQVNKRYRAIIRFNVIKSLDLTELNSTYSWNNGSTALVPVMNIEAVAEQVTLTINVSPEDILLITSDKTFNKVTYIYDREDGIARISGPVTAVNELLANLRYVRQNTEHNTTAPSIDIVISDGGKNYPVRKTIALEFLRANQDPKCPQDRPIVWNIEAGTHIQSRLPVEYCTDSDDKLIYKIGEPLPDSLRDLNFDEELATITGPVPIRPDNYTIRINASDTHGGDASFILILNIARTINAAPKIKQPFEQISVQTSFPFLSVLSFTSFLNFLPFIPDFTNPNEPINVTLTDIAEDPDQLEDLHVTIANKPSWLKITPMNMTIKGNAYYTANYTMIFTASPTPFDMNPFTNNKDSFDIIFRDEHGDSVTAKVQYKISGDSWLSILASGFFFFAGIAGLYQSRIGLHNKYLVKKYNTTYDKVKILDQKIPDGLEHKLFSDKPEEERKKLIKEITLKQVYWTCEERDTKWNYIPIIFNMTLGKLIRKAVGMDEQLYSEGEKENGLPEFITLDRDKIILKINSNAPIANARAGETLHILLLNEDGLVLEKVTILFKPEITEISDLELAPPPPAVVALDQDTISPSARTETKAAVKSRRTGGCRVAPAPQVSTTEVLRDISHAPGGVRELQRLSRPVSPTDSQGSATAVCVDIDQVVGEGAIRLRRQSGASV